MKKAEQISFHAAMVEITEAIVESHRILQRIEGRKSEESNRFGIGEVDWKSIKKKEAK